MAERDPELYDPGGAPPAIVIQVHDFERARHLLGERGMFAGPEELRGSGSARRDRGLRVTP